MKKAFLLCSFLLSASSALAVESSSCVDVAKNLVSAKFRAEARLNPDVRQPKESGIYQLAIFKDECWYDVSVEMQKNADGSCVVEKDPILDQDSANCG